MATSSKRTARSAAERYARRRAARERPHRSKWPRCPDCADNGDRGLLRYKHDLTEDWGGTVTVHQVFRCLGCGENWVRSGHYNHAISGVPTGLTKKSVSNWGELQVAADWVR